MNQQDKPSSLKQAHYYKREKELHYWKVSNVGGFQICKCPSIQQAHELVEQSGIAQDLQQRESRWIVEKSTPVKKPRLVHMERLLGKLLS